MYAAAIRLFESRKQRKKVNLRLTCHSIHAQRPASRSTHALFEYVGRSSVGSNPKLFPDHHATAFPPIYRGRLIATPNACRRANTSQARCLEFSKCVIRRAAPLHAYGDMRTDENPKQTHFKYLHARLIIDAGRAHIN